MRRRGKQKMAGALCPPSFYISMGILMQYVPDDDFVQNRKPPILCRTELAVALFMASFAADIRMPESYRVARS